MNYKSCSTVDTAHVYTSLHNSLSPQEMFNPLLR